MFICQVIASQGNGGLEKHVRELSLCLVEQGHRVLVIGDVEFVKTLPVSLETVGLNMRLSRHHPLLWFQLYRCLRKYSVDIIHAQANKAASLLASLRCLVKTPTVATLHNMKSRFKVFHHFDHVICVSEQLANQLHHQGAEVIYNGIQPSVYSSEPTLETLQQRFCLPQSKPVICAIGRLVPAKGFDVLLDAIDGMDISLILIGEGPEQKVLEKRIALLKQNTIVRLIGYHDNPITIMREVDGLVIASRREGFSYVLNEALLSGTNVLSTDVPVANEVLPRELIVPIEDPLMLRNRLQTLLDTPSYWKELMRDAQKLARKEMLLEQMVKKTVNLYSRMTKNRTANAQN
ncbi:MAG: glycosyltransferase family 4 protein [Methylotenera sp.]